MDDLYDFPADHVGRKRYVSVRGHSRSVPAFKTYKGSDGYNYLLPEYGGDLSGVGNASAYLMPDKLAYISPIDGTHVTSRSTHRDHMARHGVVEAGDLKVGDLSRSREKYMEMPRAGRDIVRAMQELNR